MESGSETLAGRSAGPLSGIRFAAPDIRCTRRRDGSTVIETADPLCAHPPRIADLVLQWADQQPEQIALADRFGAAADWRTISYGEFAHQTTALARSFVDAGLGRDRPLMLVSQNRIEAAAITFAAYQAGVPISPVTPAYSTGTGDAARLSDIIDALRPGMVIVDEPAVHALRLRQALPADTPMIGMTAHPQATATLATLLTAQPGKDLPAPYRAPDPDAVAKILFTSGSTGKPKGALNTHRMLASNSQALRQAWPFVAETPPILVDWLPWNHTFGGNFVLNLALGAGGTLYIDDGRPLPGEIEKSVVNAAEVRPTLHLNAPRGLDMVARVLAGRPDLAKAFFSRLQLVFFASAGLPLRIREEWKRLIDTYAAGPVAFCSAWGTTETAPLATILNVEAAEINNVGVPIAGTTVKLAPVDGRLELRVKGPNVTPGYLGRTDLNSALFDDEGFLRTGDVGRLANPEDPQAGILFDGRLAEDFKLSSGVWVNVGGLRAQLIEAIGSAVRDIVLSGPGRDELTALFFMDLEQCSRLAGRDLDWTSLANDPAVAGQVEAAVHDHNRANPKSSRRIARFKVMSRALDPAQGEVTEKGAVNQAMVLKREAALCAALHDGATLEIGGGD